MDAGKAAVVVISVIEHRGRLPAGDDATRAAVVRTRCRHGVLVIVISRSRRQTLFAILEYDAITPLGKRPAMIDQAQSRVAFRWQSKR